MAYNLDRRALLRTISASIVLGATVQKSEAASGMRFGPGHPFSFEGLKSQAERLAKQPYVEPPSPSGEIVSKLDYQAWGSIIYNTENALYADGGGPYPITFFHLGQFFRKSVAMNFIENGEARPVIYDSALFNMPSDSPAQHLKEGVGFAGFKIQEARYGTLDWRKNDWAAFLGASYFRAIGELFQYGLSARGLAIDVAVAGKPEEFPDFVKFYLHEVPDSHSVSIYALLDSRSATGAYHFVLTRDKAVIMDIEASLFLRNDITRLGLTPLTSMYWFSETAKPTATDWRPEVHDSDGLALWNGAGERIWRPLNNPPHIMLSSFLDDNPRGFGLLQRDRNFDHYQDGVYYDKRPSLWVEPKGRWGKGAVELIEIPTDDEIHDNIVAQWVPDKPARAGEQIDIAYRLYWQASEPFPSPLAICVATRLGNGGQPGLQRPKAVRKFVVEFLGGPLENLPFGVKPEAVLTASRGSFSYIFTEAVADGIAGHWRASFDLAVAGAEPVELRCYLKAEDKVLSETWAFQYHPF